MAHRINPDRINTVPAYLPHKEPITVPEFFLNVYDATIMKLRQPTSEEIVMLGLKPIQSQTPPQVASVDTITQLIETARVCPQSPNNSIKSEWRPMTSVKQL